MRELTHKEVSLKGGMRTKKKYGKKYYDKIRKIGLEVRLKNKLLKAKNSKK